MENISRILIKGMVCNRCVMAVKEELANLGHVPERVSLGEVTLSGSHERIDKTELKKKLHLLGFSLIEDRKLNVISDVKALVQEVYSGNYDFPEGFRFSKLVSERLGKDYDTVSAAFIEMENKTIEQYLIEYRLSKVKEFLVYTSLTLSDIAFKLNFNSVAHLSSQFKQKTGLTPSFFKEIKRQKTEVAFSAN